MFTPLSKGIVTMLISLVLSGPTAAQEVLVFAAASLTEALEDIAEAWEADTGHSVTLSLAGSSALARQIEAGAPADLFISANVAWMDRLEASGAIRPETRRNLASNSLVLIGTGANLPQLQISTGLDLPDRLGEERLAMALVDAVPAGIYGKTALQSLGLWSGVAPLVAQADNVRSALALVAIGAAPLGIVYATDAEAEPRVSVLGVFPTNSHPAILYPAAQVASSVTPEAAAFLDHLSGPKAAEVFGTYGFGPSLEVRDDARSDP